LIGKRPSRKREGRTREFRTAHPLPAPGSGNSGDDGPRVPKASEMVVTHADQSPVVHVRGLSKAYGRVPAVCDLDLDVGYGEIFAILGPNGAGKSTTIEILEGHRKRDSGQVRVLGEDPGTAGRSWRAKIGIVLQEASDAGMLTVSEIVRMFASCYGKARRPQEVLELVGLGSLSGSKVRTLSGGQRRRLDVALGIISMPELLFLDEPTTGFDPEARRQFWDLIRLLAGDGTTILLTTHYLEEAAALADRVAVIADGRLVAVDSPARLIGYASSAATVRWLEGDEVHVEETEHPTELIRRRSTDGAELAQLTVTRPTLEDAYLQLIGRA
jgi:ABC-2 type transport system ATP-binding protein